MGVFENLYEQLDPNRPLEADEVELYVNWQEQLGADDVKTLLTRRISRSRTPACRLFTGHRGVGKTTELKRVAYKLRHGDAGRNFFVSFLEAEAWLDLNDPQPTDVVFSIVRKLVDDFDAAGVGLAREKFQGFLGDFVEFVNQDVELKQLKFGLKGAAGAGVELTAALKEGAPRVRATLRKLLEGQQTRLIDLINEVLRKGRQQLQHDGKADDLLVIVDGLEKVPRKELRKGVTNHEDLFVHNAHNLKFLGCHSLFTIPVELAYSSARNQLVQEYTEVFALPTVPVTKPDDSPHELGTTALRDMVSRRAKKAGVELGGLFRDTADLDRLIRLSGGHVRNLFISLLAALDRSDELPLSPECVEHAVRRLAVDAQFGLRPDEWSVLRSVHATKKEPDADTCAEFKEDPEVWYRQLRGLFAFYYEEQGKRWYDWNPLLGEAGDGE